MTTSRAMVCTPSPEMKKITDGPDVVQFHCAEDRLSSVKFGEIAIPRNGLVALFPSQGAWDRVCLCKMTPWHLRPCASCRGRALRALELNMECRGQKRSRCSARRRA